MNFQQMLQALLDGHTVTREGGPVVYLQKTIVPIYSIPQNPNAASWVQHRFPMIDRDVPYAFSEAEVAATDWVIR
jgi:hypothetical protein